MSRNTNPALAAKLEAERRLKEGISGHRTGLPKKLLDLFAPLDPPDRLTEIKKPKLKLPYTGVAQHIGEFAEPGDPEYEPSGPEGIPVSPRLFANPELRAQTRLDTETRQEKRLRVSASKQEQAKQHVDEGLKGWDPAKDPTATGDPFKTLFVARVSYEATERKLKRDFEEYGPVKSIRLVHDRNNGKSRGYAFIEYEHKNDMKLAYKMADGKKIEGKRVVVDVERGRTVSNWKPRRFGGGKGGESREAKASKKRPTVPSLAGVTTAAVPIVPSERPADDKHREADRDRDRERPRAPGREHGDRERGERTRGTPDLTRVPPPGTDAAKRDYERREVNGRADGARDADRDRRERKRDRPDREPGEREREDPHRSNKRHREERSRRRERDLV